jgi:hypothetical protein
MDACIKRSSGPNLPGHLHQTLRGCAVKKAGSEPKTGLSCNGSDLSKEISLLQGSIDTDGRDKLVVAQEHQQEEGEQYQLQLEVMGMEE